MNAKNVIYRGNEVDLKIGDEWFGYDLGASPLGEGAMGTVYLGQSFLTGQKVAIKRVHDKYANIPSIRKRAKLEASLEFRHPNLVEMIGYCEEQPNRGPIFIVSRLVHGVTLEQYVKVSLNSCPKEIRVQKICEFIYRVLDALDFIHSRNVIHMDIKPSNIMLENGSNVRLMDLGIAFAGDDMDITSAGLVGTPKYAAPEGQPTSAPNGNMMSAFQYANEHEMRQGVTLAIVGLGLILFFALLGVDFLAALSVIPFLFGLAKIFIPYLRRNRSNPPTPPMPNIPQQPAPEPADSRQQQPETGNTTTMPPTFNHGENAGTDSENKDGENK